MELKSVDQSLFYIRDEIGRLYGNYNPIATYWKSRSQEEPNKELQQVELAPVVGTNVCMVASAIQERLDLYVRTLSLIGVEAKLYNKDIMNTIGISDIVAPVKSDLIGKKVFLQRWLLPVLYGSLGAVVYLIVRILEKPSKSISLKFAALRVFFGAFVGYSVAGVIIPSGIYSMAPGNLAPFAMLVAFVLGYSVESFIALLDAVNGLISRKLGGPSGD